MDFMGFLDANILSNSNTADIMHQIKMEEEELARKRKADLIKSVQN